MRIVFKLGFLHATISLQSKRCYPGDISHGRNYEEISVIFYQFNCIRGGGGGV